MELLEALTGRHVMVVYEASQTCLASITTSSCGPQEDDERCFVLTLSNGQVVQDVYASRMRMVLM